MVGTMLATLQFSDFVEQYIDATTLIKEDIGKPLTKYISFLCPPAQLRYIKELQLSNNTNRKQPKPFKNK